VTTEPLNPSVAPLYQERFAENTAGIIAAITACIVAAGGAVVAYPSNTAGVIQALLDLRSAISTGGSAGVAAFLPVTAGETLQPGDAVYMGVDGLVYKASNTGTRAEANVSGLTGLSTGADYFLGLSGGYGSTAPVGGGVYLTMVGQALSPTEIDVQPQTPLFLN
jgi:hypothetical protein